MQLGVVASKSWVGRVLPEMSMRLSPWFERRTSRPEQLSTRTRLFSTRDVGALHVRDLDFVTLFHICTYRGTGADSRVALPSAPAMPMSARFAPVQFYLESLALRRSLPFLSPFTRPAPLTTRHVPVTV